MIDNILDFVADFDFLYKFREVCQNWKIIIENKIDKNYNKFVDTYKVAICYNDSIIILGKKNEVFIYSYNNRVCYDEDHIVLNKNLHSRLLPSNNNPVFSKIDGIPQNYSLIDIKINQNIIFLTFVVNNLKKVFYSFGYSGFSGSSSLGRYSYQKQEVPYPKSGITEIAPLLIYRSRDKEALKIFKILNTSNNDDGCTTLLLTNVGLVLIGLNPKDKFFGPQEWNYKIKINNLLYLDGVANPPPIILEHPDLSEKIKKVTLSKMHILCLMENGDLYGCGANFRAMGFTSQKIRTMFEKINLPEDYYNNKIIDIESTEDYSFLLMSDGNIICFIGERKQEFLRLLLAQENGYYEEDKIIEQKYKVFAIKVEGKKVNEKIINIKVNYADDVINLLAITDKSKIFSIKEFSIDEKKILDFVELKNENASVVNLNYKIVDLVLSFKRSIIVASLSQGGEYIIYYDEDDLFKKLPFPNKFKQYFFPGYLRSNANAENNINNLNLYEYYENHVLLSNNRIVNTKDIQYHHLPSNNFFRIKNESKLVVAIKYNSLEELYKIYEQLKEDELNSLINQVNYEGNLPIVIAIKIKNFDSSHRYLVTRLILYGANLDVFDTNQNHLLHLAVTYHCLELLKTIIKLYPNRINILNNLQQNALFMVVASEGYYLKDAEHIGNLLIDAGANVDLKDASGTHLIHVLAKKDYLNLLKKVIFKLPFESIWVRNAEGASFLNILLNVKEKRYNNLINLKFIEKLMTEIIFHIVEKILAVAPLNSMDYLKEIIYFGCYFNLIEVVEKILLINPQILLDMSLKKYNFLHKVEHDLNSNIVFSFKILEIIIENLDFKRNKVKNSFLTLLLQYFIINYQDEYTLSDITLNKLLSEISPETLGEKVIYLIANYKNHSFNLEKCNKKIFNKIIIHCINNKDSLDKYIINKIFCFVLEINLFDTAIYILNNLNNNDLMLEDEKINKEVVLLAINNNNLGLLNKLAEEHNRFPAFKQNTEQLIILFLTNYMMSKYKLNQNDEKFLIVLIDNAKEIGFNLDSNQIEHIIFGSLSIRDYLILIAINHDYNTILFKLFNNYEYKLRFLEVFILNELNKRHFFVKDEIFSKIIDAAAPYIIGVENFLQISMPQDQGKILNLLVGQHLLLTAIYTSNMKVIRQLLKLDIPLTFGSNNLPLVWLIAKYNLDSQTVILRELIEVSLNRNIEVYDEFIKAGIHCNLFGHYLKYGYKNPEICNKKILDFNNLLKIDQWCLLYSIEFNIRLGNFIQDFFELNFSLQTEKNIPLLFIILERGGNPSEEILTKLIDKSIEQGIDLRNDYDKFNSKNLGTQIKFIKNLILICIKQNYRLLLENILSNSSINLELFEHKQNFECIIEVLNDSPYYFNKHNQNDMKIRTSLTLEFFIKFSTNKGCLDDNLVEKLLISLLHNYEDLEIVIELLNNINIINNLNSSILTKLLNSILRDDEFKKIITISKNNIFLVEEEQHNHKLILFLEKIIHLNYDFKNSINENSYKVLLYFAVNNLHLELLKTLLKFNLNINFFVSNSETLLYRAIMNWYFNQNVVDKNTNIKYIEIIKLLVDCGGKIHPLDYTLKRTIAFANEYECSFILDKLSGNMINTDNKNLLYNYKNTNNQTPEVSGVSEASSITNRNLNYIPNKLQNR